MNRIRWKWSKDMAKMNPSVVFHHNDGDDSPITIKDRSTPTERTVTITLNQHNISEAIFMWLRLQDIELPSQRINDYKIYYSGNEYNSHSGDKLPVAVELTFKENL